MRENRDSFMEAVSRKHFITRQDTRYVKHLLLSWHSVLRLIAESAGNT